MSESWIYSWQQCFLKVHRQFSLLENSTNEDHGFYFHWTSGQKPQLIKHGRKIDCNTANYVPFVVTVLSTSSSSSIFTYFSNIFIAGNSNSHGAYSINKKWEYDWGSTRKLVAWTETEKLNKNDDNEEVRGNSFKDNLVDESVPEHRDASSSAHELPSERRAKVVQSKHNIFTHFPKDRNCNTCLRTKITKAFCRRRTSTVVPRSENFGDFLTADHKVLSEGCESRNNHRYAAVVQDLATQWIQSYPCKTNASQETQKSLQRFWEPTRKPKVIYTDNWQILWRPFLESMYVNTAQIGN